MDNYTEVPVLLLTGFLGSGKTTLLNHILTNEKGYCFAVIVNDLGEVNIDAELVQKGGVVNDGKGDLVALQNGCICCSLSSDLMRQLADLSESGNFDYIVIEASGICEPAPIAQTVDALRVAQMQGAVPVRVTLDSIVSVVDARRLHDEFENGRALTENADEEPMVGLVVNQIEFCNVILLNKISEVSHRVAAELRAIVATLQPEARIIECDYCRVDLDDIIGTGAFNFEHTATSAAWIKGIEGDEDEDEEHDHHDHHDHSHCDHEHGHCCHHDHEHHHDHAAEFGIESFVYKRRKPFDLNKFDYMIGREWPRSIIRSKGVVYFSSNPDMSYLFETAGTQRNLTEAGRWYATAPQEELEQMLEADPMLRRDWDPEYGDRMIKLVIIGRNMDRKAITAMLDSCLA